MARGHLLLRADADHEIGMGHLMRCSALAEEWRRRGGRVSFLTRCPHGAVVERLARLGRVETPPLPPRPGNDLPRVMERMYELAADASWVALDGYGFGLGTQRAMRGLGARLLVIDDTAHLPAYEADLLLNVNPGAERLGYRVAEGTVRLLGTQYVLLRSQFASATPRHRSGAVRNCLVTLGGGNPEAALPRVLEGIIEAGITGANLRIVAGSAAQVVHSFGPRFEAAGLKAEVLADVEDMAALMDWADVAVTAAGTTAWELARLGVPSYVFPIANNQCDVARGLLDKGAAIGTADTAGPEATAVARGLRRLYREPALRASLSRAAMALIDGRGQARVVDAMDRVGRRGDALSVRSAGPDDAELLWTWANDPSVRRLSFRPESIPWEAHLVWYREKLASPATAFLILDVGDRPAGQVRYDRRPGTTEAEVSFTIAPTYRGRGYGTELLRRTVGLAFERLQVDGLRAVSFTDNAASARAFTKAGFAARGVEEIQGRPCLVFLRRREDPP